MEAGAVKIFGEWCERIEENCRRAPAMNVIRVLFKESVQIIL